MSRWNSFSTRAPATLFGAFPALCYQYQCTVSPLAIYRKDSLLPSWHHSMGCPSSPLQPGDSASCGVIYPCQEASAEDELRTGKTQ